MLELGYSVPPVIYYHFRIPHEDLDFGLRVLGNDNDVLNLAQYIGDNKNPGIPLRALQEQLQKDFEVGVSIDNVFRAKAIVTKIVKGDYTKQYEFLRDYVLELQATNVDTTVKIDVYSEHNPSNPTRKFKRIYICLDPLKKGFKAGFRDLLGFDGAHMKRPFPGQVLTTVGLDSNNDIYPLLMSLLRQRTKVVGYGSWSV
uniref:Uncharacterized protein n=1 Tax=Lactuca sativa TaxID=4236 RepID=A0A9R1X3G5_LACSA|nr:hypothetical protein LSAT_V11C700387090 [Lactuca sativa]